MTPSLSRKPESQTEDLYPTKFFQIVGYLWFGSECTVQLPEALCSPMIHQLNIFFFSLSGELIWFIFLNNQSHKSVVCDSNYKTEPV